MRNPVIATGQAQIILFINFLKKKNENKFLFDAPA